MCDRLLGMSRGVGLKDGVWAWSGECGLVVGLMWSGRQVKSQAEKVGVGKRPLRKLGGSRSARDLIGPTWFLSCFNLS